MFFQIRFPFLTSYNSAYRDFAHISFNYMTLSLPFKEKETSHNDARIAK